ncbi:MAG: hypothetical protein CFE24_08755 [Flavobacterium sp. BFFFF2]|nr:MAG: hypothetical protein CFE24_08755 [Flavobacterium sp. BFFFF2]
MKTIILQAVFITLLLGQMAVSRAQSRVAPLISLESVSHVKPTLFEFTFPEDTVVHLHIMPRFSETFTLRVLQSNGKAIISKEIKGNEDIDIDIEAFGVYTLELKAKDASDIKVIMNKEQVNF